MVSMMLFAYQDSDEELITGTIEGADWIQAGGILLAALLIAIVLSRVLRRIMARGIGESLITLVVGRLASYVIFLVGLFYSLTALGVQVGPLLGALGIGGLVAAFALQSVAESFVSSFVIQARRPYTIGEQVELDGHRGTVVDIDARTTLLNSVDGTQVRIPNANVTTNTIVNLTREPVRRSELDVGVAYDTDLEFARQVLFDAIGRVPGVQKKPPPVVCATGFDDSSIGLRILYWHKSDIGAAIATRTDLIVAVHQALFAESITIAFPQVEVWSAEAATEPIYVDEPGIVELHASSHSKPKQVRKRTILPPLRRSSRE